MGKKRTALEMMEGQHHLWKYYENVAENRGNHFREIQVVSQAALTLATLKPFSRYTQGLFFHCNILGLGLI